MYIFSDTLILGKPHVLMCADVKVATYSERKWTIYRPELFPKGLDSSEGMMVDELGDESPRTNYSYRVWLASRVLSIDRVYAKKLMLLLGLSQQSDLINKSRISMIYRAISLLDSYWIKFGEDDDNTWDQLNLRKNSLSKAIATVALTGDSYTLQIKQLEYTAEVTTVGLCPKGWFRDDTGILWLYKTDANQQNYVNREICASNIIDCFNIYGNLKYDSVTMYDIACSKSRLMSDEEKSVVHAADIDVWSNINYGINVLEWALQNYKKEVSQMLVIDYLIANPDRHLRNWGIYQEVQTGDILGLHELYDHNNAFDEMYMKDETLPSVIDMSFTHKQLAEKYVEFSGLKLLRKPDFNEFPNKLAYDTFFKRCKNLNININ